MMLKKRILITRQEKYSVNLTQKLCALGAICESLPLIEIEDLLDDAKLAYIVTEIKKCALVIFVSRNAAQIVTPYLDLNKGLVCACMGPATADYLHTTGLTSLIYPKSEPFDTMSLMAELESNNTVLDGQRVILFAGENSNDLLVTKLRELGAECNLIPVYRRTMPKLSVSLVEKKFNTVPNFDIIIISCVTSLINLQQLTKNIWQEILKIPLLVVSARISQHALDMGFLNVYTAKGMSDVAILAKLEEWCS